MERKPEGETRILVVGDSTTIDGGDIANTLPGRIERILRADGLGQAKVYNFGVMSSCLTQMTHLIWSRLVTYSPDAIVVLSGSTDLFQPWTYDPGPATPTTPSSPSGSTTTSSTRTTRAREDGLSYDALVTLIYEELKRLRAEVGWQSPGWEDAIVHQYERAAHRLTKLSHDHAVPIVSVLQPTVLRKRHLTEVERGVASGAFLAYLDRNTPSWRRSRPRSRRGARTGGPSRPSTTAGSFATGRRGRSTTSSTTTIPPGRSWRRVWRVRSAAPWSTPGRGRPWSVRAVSSAASAPLGRPLHPVGEDHRQPRHHRMLDLDREQHFEVERVGQGEAEAAAGLVHGGRHVAEHCRDHVRPVDVHGMRWTSPSISATSVAQARLAETTSRTAPPALLISAQTRPGGLRDWRGRRNPAVPRRARPRCSRLVFLEAAPFAEEPANCF